MNYYYYNVVIIGTLDRLVKRHQEQIKEETNESSPTENTDVSREIQTFT